MPHTANRPYSLCRFSDIPVVMITITEPQTLVAKEGLEPSRSSDHWILSPARLPFHHSAIGKNLVADVRFELTFSCPPDRRIEPGFPNRRLLLQHTPRTATRCSGETTILELFPNPLRFLLICEFCEVIPVTSIRGQHHHLKHHVDEFLFSHSSIVLGSGRGSRTLRGADFESVAFTSFAIPPC